ncbi:MAG TPA: Uma2 family endonuclease [Chloroflexia bacterium]|jgi:Uma2 family endonuclease
MAIHVEQETAVKRHFVTLDEYERMCETGVFEQDARVELIRGEIVDMPPSGPEHESIVARLDRILNRLAGDAALVWPQGNAIRMPGTSSRPQPDITILRWRDDFYRDKRPVPDDVILLIEVAETSLKYDRGSKRALYAEAGITEYWVVNVTGGTVEVYTDPGEGEYKLVSKVRRGEALQLPGKLGSIAVDDVLG